MGQQCWVQLLAPNQQALAHPPMEAEHTQPLQVAFSKDGAVPVPCTPVGLVQKLCVSVTEGYTGVTHPRSFGGDSLFCPPLTPTSEAAEEASIWE